MTEEQTGCIWGKTPATDTTVVNDPLIVPTITATTSAAAATKGLYTTPASFVVTTTAPSSSVLDEQRRAHLLGRDNPPVQPSRRLFDYGETSTRIMLPEPSISPKPFSGNASDIKSAERWLRYFEQYTLYRKLKDDESLALFKLLLVDTAQDWLRAIPTMHTRSLFYLMNAFRERYFPNELHKFRTATDMWSRTQKADESVDDFITAVRTAADQTDFKDEKQIGYCIIKGLKPALRLHVLQNTHDDLDQIIHSARVAEIAQNSAGEDSTVSDLTRTVSLLVEKLTTKDANTEHVSALPTGHPSDKSTTDNKYQQPRSTQSSSAPFRRRAPPPRTVYRQQWSSAPQQRNADYSNRAQFQPRQSAQIARSIPSYGQDTAYQQQQRQTSAQRCPNCLRSHAPRQCSAFGLMCYNCGKRNHISRACRGPRRNQFPQQQPQFYTQ